MSTKPLDLTWRKFGKWFVDKRADDMPKGQGVWWYCTCECGTRKPILGKYLTSGNTTNCGCDKSKTMISQRKEQAKESAVSVLGTSLCGLLIVSVNRYDKGRTMMNCVCNSCKTPRIQSLTRLKGGVASCSCYHSEKNSSIAKAKADKEGRYIGIHEKRKGIFSAQHANKFLGYFRTATEAAKAYDKYVIEAFGYDTVLNFEPDEDDV